MGKKAKFGFQLSEQNGTLGFLSSQGIREQRIPLEASTEERKSNTIAKYMVIKLGGLKIFEETVGDTRVLKIRWLPRAGLAKALFKIPGGPNAVFSWLKTKANESRLSLAAGQAPNKAMLVEELRADPDAIKRVPNKLELRLALTRGQEGTLQKSSFIRSIIQAYLVARCGDEAEKIDAYSQLLFNRYSEITLSTLGSMHLKNQLRQKANLIFEEDNLAKSLEISLSYEKELQLTECLGLKIADRNTNRPLASNQRFINEDSVRYSSTITISKQTAFGGKHPYLKARLNSQTVLSYFDARIDAFNPSNLNSRLLAFSRRYKINLILILILSLAFVVIFTTIPPAAPLILLWGKAIFSVVASAPTICAILVTLVGSALYSQKSLAANVDEKKNTQDVLSAKKPVQHQARWAFLSPSRIVPALSPHAPRRSGIAAPGDEDIEEALAARPVARELWPDEHLAPHSPTSPGLS